MVGRTRAATEDHQEGADHGHQRPCGGELVDPVDHDAAAEDRQQPRNRGRDAKRTGHRDCAADRRGQHTGEQLPRPGVAVEIGARLVEVVGDHRVGERGHGRDGDDRHEHGASVRRSPGRSDAYRDRRRDDQHRDEELALHRHRPHVLQRADALPGAQIVVRGGGQMPVLNVREAGEALIGERLPSRLRLDPHRQRGARGQDHDDRGHQPAHQSRQGGRQRFAAAGVGRLAQQPAAEEEAGKHEEHVDATGDPAEPDVVDDDERDREPAQAVEIAAAPGYCVHTNSYITRWRWVRPTQK